MRILIVEDNPTNEKVARQLLNRLGHEAVSVENGLEAVEHLRSDCGFDCVLMDLAMPVMDGISATKQIIEDLPDSSARPRIIAVTANAFESDRVKCRDAGMDGFLPKPLRLDALRAALEDVGPPTPAALQPDALDLEQFLSIIDGGDPECVEIFDDFCKSVPEMIGEMRELASAGDATAMAKVAHQLKGSSSTFGLAAFAERMSHLEIMGKSGSLPDAGWSDDVLKAFGEAEAALRKKI